MKAVVYHADAHFAWGPEVGDFYRRLFPKFLERCHAFDMEVIHLTLDGFPGMGDKNIFYGGYDAKDVMFNREMLFCDFLEKAEDDVYWFGEPDYVLFKKWPSLKTDCAFLHRTDAVAMTPGWRMATPKAVPIFRDLRDTTKSVELRAGVGRDWHCDSDAFNKVWKKMGRPLIGFTSYLGVSVEMRDYRQYVKPGEYSRNYNGPAKLKILGDISA